MQIKQRKLLIIILILTSLLFLGCPSNPASFLMLDEGQPNIDNLFSYRNRIYHLDKTYSIEEFNRRVTNSEISKIRINFVQKNSSIVDSLMIEGQYIKYYKDNISDTILSNYVDDIVLYERIPAEMKRDAAFGMFVMPGMLYLLYDRKWAKYFSLTTLALYIPYYIYMVTENKLEIEKIIFLNSENAKIEEFKFE